MERRQLTGTVGVLLSAVDLGAVADADVAAIRAELLANKVVFVRGQDLDAQALEAFAARFGPLAGGKAGSTGGVWTRDSRDGYRADHWHTDLSYVERPASIGILSAAEVPDVGGDTSWANTVAAYDSLPPALRVLADTVRVVHDYTPARGTLDRAARSEASRRLMFSDRPSLVTEHPMVAVHPETGERALLLGSYARHICGFSDEASALILQAFQTHISRPEHTLRWHWSSGDVAMWDNRATQHFATSDYGDATRVMRRATVEGDVVIGVDGRPSLAIEGGTTAFVPQDRASRVLRPAAIS